MKIFYQSLWLVIGMGISTLSFACQVPKSYYKNVSCTARSGVYLAVKDNGMPVALLDKKGEKMADLFAYEMALGGEFRSGLLPVRKGGKVGYINEQGKVVVGFNYQPMNGKSWARGVYDGRIVVRQNGGLGVIDTTGKIIVKADKNITSISDFAGGRATVVAKTGTYVIDKSGQKLSSTPTTTPKPMPSTQTAKANTPLPKPAVPMVLFPRQVDGKWGFVNGDGVPMIKYVFDEVKPYSEGLAGVRQGNKWGFIDVGGNLVVPFRFEVDGFDLSSQHLPKYQEPLMFYQGKAWIANLHDGTKLCINKKGVNVEC